MGRKPRNLQKIKSIRVILDERIVSIELDENEKIKNKENLISLKDYSKNQGNLQKVKETKTEKNDHYVESSFFSLNDDQSSFDFEDDISFLNDMNDDESILKDSFQSFGSNFF